MFGNLESGKHDYGDLVRALEERFAPPNQTELFSVQLRERRQKASESMAVLGQDIRRLTNLAYPKAPCDVRETLAKEQFVDALVNTEMRLKIKQARPVDFNDAVRHAVELEAFYRAESRQAGQGFINTTVSSEQVNDKKLAETFSSLNNRLDEMTKVMNKLFKYIVVIGDYFTKWTEALPIPNMEACTVAKVLVEKVLCRFGIPQVIHSDQGRQFESNLFQEMCKLLGIHKTRTTPYHPQSDGMVERFNRTLAAMLSAYVSENHRDWDEQLPYVTMAYRSTEHETSGMSPNMLITNSKQSVGLGITGPYRKGTRTRTSIHTASYA